MIAEDNLNTDIIIDRNGLVRFYYSSEVLCYSYKDNTTSDNDRFGKVVPTVLNLFYSHPDYHVIVKLNDEKHDVQFYSLEI